MNQSFSHPLWWVVGGGVGGVGGGGGPQDFCVSQSSFWTNKGFELGWTGLGLGLGVLRTKGSGQCSH